MRIPQTVLSRRVVTAAIGEKVRLPDPRHPSATDPDDATWAREDHGGDQRQLPLDAQQQKERTDPNTAPVSPA
jgi:hypothetical protein